MSRLLLVSFVAATGILYSVGQFESGNMPHHSSTGAFFKGNSQGSFERFFNHTVNKASLYLGGEKLQVLQPESPVEEVKATSLQVPSKTTQTQIIPSPTTSDKVPAKTKDAIAELLNSQNSKGLSLVLSQDMSAHASRKILMAKAEDPGQLAALIKRELRRLNCFNGVVNKNWDIDIHDLTGNNSFDTTPSVATLNKLERTESLPCGTSNNIATTTITEPGFTSAFSAAIPVIKSAIQEAQTVSGRKNKKLNVVGRATETYGKASLPQAQNSVPAAMTVGRRSDDYVKRTHVNKKYRRNRKRNRRATLTGIKAKKRKSRLRRRKTASRKRARSVVRGWVKKKKRRKNRRRYRKRRPTFGFDGTIRF